MLLVAWRLTSMLMDLVLLVIIVTGLVVYRRWPFKRKTRHCAKGIEMMPLTECLLLTTKTMAIKDCRCGESPCAAGRKQHCFIC